MADSSNVPQTPVDEVHQSIKATQRRNGIAYILLGILLAALVFALWWAKNESNNANEYKRLYEHAANLCADPTTTLPECQKAVAKAESGAPGPAGAAGERGPVGPAGPPGPTGPSGPSGQDGLDGKRGPRGFTGLDGPAGPVGRNGADGANGAKGEAGDTGPKGDTGDTGPRGDVGPKGDNGDKGDPGPPGVVAVVDQCSPAAGEFVTDVSMTYDAGTQTLTLTCTSAAFLPRGP